MGCYSFFVRNNIFIERVSLDKIRVFEENTLACLLELVENRCRIF